MNFLKRIKDILFGSSTGELKDPNGIIFYVKCDKCGAPVRIRVDKYNDLMRDFDTGGFILNKEIMDGSCFSLMHATIHFDPARRILEQNITGGTFISWEAYQALTQPSQPSN